MNNSMKSYSWICIKAQLKRQTFQHKGTDNAHTWVVRVSIRADQHTDRGTCLFRGFRKIEQRMWPAPTVSVFGGDWAAEMKALAPYYDDPKVVAVGECGLDYHWPVPKDAQLALFEAELRLALELDKPIIVHDRSAHADVYALLKKYRPKGIVHCYSGSAEDAVWLAAQGLYFGFGGACTFKGAKRAAKAISALPLERIVLETDCPYMAPEPVRGTRCDSSLIRYVGEYIASVKGLSPEEVFRQTVQNARAVYQL